jgi:hypothetical protein
LIGSRRKANPRLDVITKNIATKRYLVIIKQQQNWKWSKVAWPELYIASPYYELAATGFFICQPTTQQECDAQSEREWHFWTNSDFNECRIQPTEIEACLELPNLRYNDIVESFWENQQCMVISEVEVVEKRSLLFDYPIIFKRARGRRFTPPYAVQGPVKRFTNYFR